MWRCIMSVMNSYDSYVTTESVEAKCAFDKPGFFGRTNFCRFDNRAFPALGPPSCDGFRALQTEKRS